MPNESTVEAISGMAFADEPPEAAPERPPRTPERPPRTPSAPPRKTSTKELEQGLEDMFGLYALYLQMAKGDLFCSTYVLDNCEVPARAWAKLAEKNPTVNRILSVLAGEPGAWAEVFMTTVSFAMPMLAHHGRIPVELAAQMNAVTPPEVIKPQPSRVFKRVFKRKTVRPSPRPAGNTEEGASVIAEEAVTESPPSPDNGWSGVPVEAGDHGPH